MKAFFYTIFAIFLAVQTAWSDPLRLVSDAYFPPYSYTENGEVKGIDIDIVNEAARRADVHVTIELYPWKRVLMMMKTDLTDGAFSMFRNEERETYAHFSQNPVHVSQLTAFMSKDSLAVYKKIEDLLGKTVFISAGFSISDEFDQFVRNGNIKPAYVLNAEDGIKRLLASDSGCFISNRISILYYAKRLGLSHKIEFIPTLVESNRKAYLALSKVKLNTPDRKRLFDRLDAELGEMIRDGTVRRITDSYIK